jgi:cell wall-associated NlpC family hydrolase
MQKKKPDCSGFLNYSFGLFGLELPTRSIAQRKPMVAVALSSSKNLLFPADNQ